MMNLLFRLSDVITLANTPAAQMTAEPATPIPIGFVVLAVIVGPVIVLTIAAMFGAPRTFRIPGLFLGSLALLVGAIVLAFAAMSALLGFIVPQ